MLFLEKVILNVLLVVVVMFIDRYALDDACKNNPLCDASFKLWLIATSFSVAWYLIRYLSTVEVLAI